jgi:hypothetical protein
MSHEASQGKLVHPRFSAARPKGVPPAIELERLDQVLLVSLSAERLVYSLDRSVMGVLDRGNVPASTSAGE